MTPTPEHYAHTINAASAALEAVAAHPLASPEARAAADAASLEMVPAVAHGLTLLTGAPMRGTVSALRTSAASLGFMPSPEARP